MEVELDSAGLGRWLQSWWFEASPLAERVAHRVDSTWSWTLLTNANEPRAEINDTGVGADAFDRSDLAAFVASATRAPSTLIVEDDLGRARDGVSKIPNVSHGFVEDRVVRWTTTAHRDIESALMWGTSGLPLIMCVCEGDDRTLGLRDAVPLSAAAIGAVVASAVLVATAIHDSEDVLVGRRGRVV